VTADTESDWRDRWASDREYTTRAAVEWATGMVAAGTPPMLVSDALAAAAEAVRRGIEANAAEILETLRAQAPTD
jgi:hypothetical protein